MIGAALLINFLFSVLGAVLALVTIGSTIGLSSGLDDLRFDTMSDAEFASIGGVVGIWGLALIIGVVLYYASQALITGFATHVVGQASLGRKATLGWLWRETRGRVLAICLAVVLIGFVAFGFLLVGMGFLVAGFVSDSATGITLGVIAALVVVLAYVAVSVLFSLATPAIVFEKSGPVKGLSRSWTLVKKSFWRVLLLHIVGSIVAQVAVSVIIVPVQVLVTVVGMGGASASGSDEATGIVGLSLVALQAIAQFIAVSLVQPFMSAIVALLYLDMRMRHEALDVQLIQSVSSQAQPPHGPTALGPSNRGGFGT